MLQYVDGATIIDVMLFLLIHLGINLYRKYIVNTKNATDCENHQYDNNRIGT